MCVATDGIVLPTTVIGSLPRPTWYVENLGQRSFSEAIINARFAEVVGRENVIAGTDCGLGGRIHEDLVWAKLEALVEGAALASRRSWK